MTKKITSAVAIFAVCLALSPGGTARAQQTLSAPLAGGASSAAPTAPGAAVTASVAPNYRLDTGDTIRIEVAKHPDASQTVVLIADALVSLPRLDKPVSARGKTVSELALDLNKALNNPRAFRLRPGQVTVSVVIPRQRRIYVRGNAVTGGDYDLKNGWRITELVAVLGKIPQPDRVTARITNPNRPEPVMVNLNEAVSNDASPANIALQEGDTVSFEAPRARRLVIDGEGPRGLHEVDERLGLRDALSQIGFTTNGATGDLRAAYIMRPSVPGDPNSPRTSVPVDLYTLMTEQNAPDFPLVDMDKLVIPVSEKYVYVFGEAGGPRKWYMPQDRRTFLVDVLANAGGPSGNAKVGKVRVTRVATATGEPKVTEYDFGKYLKNGNPALNPEIQAQDIVFVPNATRTDPINSIWTGFGLFNLARSLVPGLF